jgi:hypothetical protein
MPITLSQFRLRRGFWGFLLSEQDLWLLEVHRVAPLMEICVGWADIQHGRSNSQTRLWLEQVPMADDRVVIGRNSDGA